MIRSFILDIHWIYCSIKIWKENIASPNRETLNYSTLPSGESVYFLQSSIKGSPLLKSNFLLWAFCTP